MRNIVKPFLLIAVGGVLVTLLGCATITAQPFPEKEQSKTSYRLYTLNELTSLEYTEAKTEGALTNQITGLRDKTMRETAYSVGSQSALAYRTHQINQLLEANADVISRIYNFSPFLIDGRALYPVVMKSQRMYEQESDKRARLVSVSYLLSKPARLVPEPPSWREYLIRPVVPPELPNPSLFPQTSAEKAIWIKEVTDGWRDGLEQAEQINEFDIQRLERDYTGMQQFRILLAQGIVQLPEISTGDHGVVKDGKTLNVEDVIYEITSDADFTESKKWAPVFRP